MVGRVLRVLLVLLALASCAAGAAMMWLYADPSLQLTGTRAAMASSFVPYGILAWAVAVVCFLVAAPHWWKMLAYPALVCLIIQVGWAKPYWPHPPLPGQPSATVRLFSANVLYGKADPASVADAITAADAEVVSLLEVSQPLLDSPRVQEALARYPYRHGTAAAGWAAVGYEDPTHTMVFSRIPFTHLETLDVGMESHVLRLQGEHPLILMAVHPMNMVQGTELWVHEAAVVREALDRYADRPTVAIGDFNAAPEQVPLRDTLARGYRLGAQDAGAGWQPTYRGRLTFPAMVPIDHVVTNQRATTTSFHAVRIAGSDHRAIIAEVAPVG